MGNICQNSVSDCALLQSLSFGKSLHFKKKKGATKGKKENPVSPGGLSKTSESQSSLEAMSKRDKMGTEDVEESPAYSPFRTAVNQQPKQPNCGEELPLKENKLELPVLSSFEVEVITQNTKLRYLFLLQMVGGQFYQVEIGSSINLGMHVQGVYSVTLDW
ncbi:hypothetical protein PR048_005340 [Dryococelus australis]|uniref:Uncharacterized protein n=1 Tax=Dryococelus australis TaxID=614101 RepID=A0ABQ9I7Y1_9NEOP|nr:hypothetical protein PR048_005340 [Dryococelus australis]